MDFNQILPKLYVGSYPRYDDIDILKRYGITAVLNVQSDDDLRDKLPEAVRVLSELVDEKHDVFVHCNAGANRSPSLVIAWLSWKQGWSLEEAERHVIGCHPCAPVMDVVRLAGRDVS